MSFSPPMTGNCKHTSYKHGDDWGMVYGYGSKLGTPIKLDG